MKTVEPIYSSRDVEKFLEILRAWNRNYYTAAVIGINWGLRVSDTLALKVGQLVAGTEERIQAPDMIRLNEIKTGRERCIIVNRKMKKVIHEHIKHIASKAGAFDPTMPLILSRNRGKDGKGKSLSRYALHSALKSAAQQAGIREHIGAQSLRKTFVYQAWRLGMVSGRRSIEFHQYACIPLREESEIYELMTFA